MMVFDYYIKKTSLHEHKLSLFLITFAQDKNRKRINYKLILIMAYVIGDDCVACGTCIDECPVGAISEGEKYSIDPEQCTECGTCADACPSGAISL